MGKINTPSMSRNVSIFSHVGLTSPSMLKALFSKLLVVATRNRRIRNLFLKSLIL